MARFTEPDWNSLDPAADDAHAPSFLRDWAERPDPTDLRLHFADAGPVYGAPAEPARPAPAPGPGPGEAAAVPGAYSSMAAAEWTSHEVAPDSWLAAVPALPHPAPGQEAAHAPSTPGLANGNGRSWDPLLDPWPASDDRLEATLLEHAVREEIDPLGLAYAPPAYAPPANTERSYETARYDAARYETAPYEPVVFEPAPYVPPAAPAAQRSPRREEHAAIQTQPVYLDPDHPSGPLPQAGMWPPSAVVPESPAGLERPARAVETVAAPAVAPAEAAAPTSRPYDVTLVGSLGEAEFGFGNGWWYSLAGDVARPVSVGDALRAQPDKAGQITQLVCWWLRENPNAARALDLATELSLAVSDLASRNLASQAFAAPNPASRHARVPS